MSENISNVASLEQWNEAAQWEGDIDAMLAEVAREREHLMGECRRELANNVTAKGSDIIDYYAWKCGVTSLTLIGLLTVD